MAGPHRSRDLASAFMELAGILSKLFESRDLASHLSLQIGFSVLLRSLDLLLLRSFLELPCPGPWFG